MEWESIGIKVFRGEKLMEERMIVFYGNFNPITTAHKEMILESLKYLEPERLLIVPSSDLKSYNKDLNSYHRVNMINAVFRNYKRVRIDFTDLNASRKISLSEVLLEIEKNYTDKEMYYLLGTDDLLEFSKEEKLEEVLEKYELIVTQREGFDLDEIISKSEILTKFKDKITQVPIIKYAIVSSSKVREMVLDGKFEELEGSLEPEVIKYIKEKNLYKH